ncbi:MAG: hypothetical protein HLUCCO07_01765 [Rhodobacteraceae bacterium HLUCCO07]|nr:MAG: hypothetical protein HLUCCO07_01765 [Rhodobacteraceae bacterium HLUCCO07]
MVARRVVAVSSKNKPVTYPTGANTTIENKAEKPALSNAKSRPNRGKFMKPAHKRMARILGYALTLGDHQGWEAFSALAQARMTDQERAALAWAALKSLDPDQAEMTAAAVLGSADAPLPPFLGGMEEARSWASYANRSELKAYALATYEALGPSDQAAFHRHINERKVAA